MNNRADSLEVEMPRGKRKTNKGKKYEQRVSLYGVSLADAIKDILKSPPLPKKKQKRK